MVVVEAGEAVLGCVQPEDPGQKELTSSGGQGLHLHTMSEQVCQLNAAMMQHVITPGACAHTGHFEGPCDLPQCMQKGRAHVAELPAAVHACAWTQCELHAHAGCAGTRCSVRDSCSRSGDALGATVRT